MANRNDRRILPRETFDTSGMRPHQLRKHLTQAARAAAMNVGGVPPKSSGLPRHN